MEVQKMIFIYNAVKDGWTVRMLENGKYEFKKSKTDAKQEVYLDTYISKFIRENLNMNNILSNNNT
jgi:hypothetical protein